MKKMHVLTLLVGLILSCDYNMVTPDKEEATQVLEGVTFNGEYLNIDEYGLSSIFSKLNESSSEEMNKWEDEIGFYSMRRFYEELRNEEDYLMTMEEKIMNGESSVDIYSLKYSDEIVSMAKIIIGREISYQAGDSPSIPRALIPYLPYISVEGKVAMSSAVHQYFEDRFEVISENTSTGRSDASNQVFYYSDLKTNTDTGGRLNNSGTHINGDRLLDATAYHGQGWYWTPQWTIQYYDYAGAQGVSKKKGLFGWHTKKTGTWSAINDYYITLSNSVTLSYSGSSSNSTQMHTWTRTFYDSRYWGYGVNVGIISTYTQTTNKGRISTAWCSVSGLYL